jgi:hypothetical protein
MYLVIPTPTKAFIDSLIDYYTNEASSYKQLAKNYSDEAGDVTVAAFGIIVGCIYSGFLQVYTNQKQKPSLEDIQEFTQIIKRRAAQIKRSILDAKA